MPKEKLFDQIFYKLWDWNFGLYVKFTFKKTALQLLKEKYFNLLTDAKQFVDNFLCVTKNQLGGKNYSFEV